MFYKIDIISVIWLFISDFIDSMILSIQVWI